MNIYIIDNKKEDIELITEYCQATPGIVLMGSSTDAVEAVEVILNGSIAVDVVVLDQQMPKLSGMEVAEIIGGKVYIIFITAFPEFALDAIRRNAVDFLVKPARYSDFLNAILKARKFLIADTKQELVNNREYYFIKKEGRINYIQIKADDIIYIEGNDKNVNIHTEAEVLVTQVTLSAVEASLPPENFIRVQKSFVVNVNKILSYEDDQLFMSNKREISVGKTYRAVLMEVIQSRLLR